MPIPLILGFKPNPLLSLANILSVDPQSHKYNLLILNTCNLSANNSKRSSAKYSKFSISNSGRSSRNDATSLLGSCNLSICIYRIFRYYTFTCR